jgi:hypothetical protein
MRSGCSWALRGSGWRCKEWKSITVYAKKGIPHPRKLNLLHGFR